MSRMNEWGETLDETVERSIVQCGLLVYSMVPGEEIEVTISGDSGVGIQTEEDRIIRASLLDQRVGKLSVLADTASDGKWTGRELCLGSCVFTLGGIPLERGGLLRGMIALGQGVVVDFSATHFTGEEPTYMLAEYRALSLQDQRIF